MRSAASLAAKHVVEHNYLAVPLLLDILAATSHAYSPVQHSLLVTAVSWLLLCLLAVFRVGVSLGTNDRQRQTAWLAGTFIGLSHICDRAACDKAGTGATKPLLPLFIVSFSKSGLFSDFLTLPTHTLLDDHALKTNTPSEFHSHAISYRLSAALIVSASAVLASYVAPPTFVLGLSSVIFAAAGFVLFEAAVNNIQTEGDHNMRGPLANGTSSRRMIISVSGNKERLTTLRDVASTIVIICIVASCFMEPSMFARTISWEPSQSKLNTQWATVYNLRFLQQAMWMIPVNVLVNIFMFIMLLGEGAVHTSIVALFAYMCAKIFSAPSLSGLCFSIVYGVSALLQLFGPSSSTPFIDLRNSLRLRRIILGVTAILMVILLVQNGSRARYQYSIDSTTPFLVNPPPSPFEPVPIDFQKGHPAAQLISAAEADFQATLTRQSKSLAAAVQEYRRRNGIAPPPRFDKWYELATRNNVVMIDEFDTINDMLLPFWALKPATIRTRVTNALGHEDIALIGVAIRNGAIEHIENGEEWQQKATAGMLKSFIQYLPDMDLAFNIHDEPRVIVPNNLLSAMVITARKEILPRTAKNSAPRNAFSVRPDDLSDGNRFAESSTTKFNRFAHQQTWSHSRLSCPANAQAQTFEDYAPDNLTAYATSPLNYIYNTTAFSDICNSPSLSSTFGFFERPNTFNVVNELTPVFSPSKISSYQDLLYPSPWYWAGKVGYDKSHDTSWENKTNSIYWRGSTTGGYSRNGGWRRQHRQHIVQRLNAPDVAQVLTATAEPTDTTGATTYSITEVDRRAFKHLINVKFSHIGQCDPGDCDAQKEFFHVTDRVDGQNAWYHKHLLDMDGNAFSGRFYSFLKSRSLTFKMAIFREWHAEWLRPWVHYIPISLKGDEHLDLIRWFAGDQTPVDADSKTKAEKEPDKGGNGDSLGEHKAREIAQRSSEWHDKALRNVDFEVWFFRLLLEYGRVIDDNREEIGYPGP